MHILQIYFNFTSKNRRKILEELLVGLQFKKCASWFLPATQSPGKSTMR